MPKQFPWKCLRLLLIVASLIPPYQKFAQAQSQPTPTTLIHAIQSTPATLHRNLKTLWQIDSTQVHHVAQAVQSAYENSNPKLQKPQADTLIRIFAIGHTQNPTDHHWLLKKALLAQRHQEYYPKHLRRWIMEAITAIPHETPTFLYTTAAKALAQEYKALQIPLNQAAKDWAILNRAILENQLNTSQDAPTWAQIRSQLTLEMRSALPDCNQLYGNFSDAIGLGNLPPDACETFLILYALQGCDQSALWEAAFSARLKAGETAWLYRLAGAEAFNRGQIAQSRSHWQKACSLETNPALQANDQLEIAATYRAEKDYRKARTAIQEAMRRHPTWGEPYLHLMDLYLVGNEACTMTQFEHKALYWLLMELCQRLKSVDAHYATEADARYYQYIQSCPTPEEASFQGFKPGDTYPLKCWMSTVATVRQP